jgi:hypothetical protein
MNELQMRGSFKEDGKIDELFTRMTIKMAEFKSDNVLNHAFERHFPGVQMLPSLFRHDSPTM